MLHQFIQEENKKLAWRSVNAQLNHLRRNSLNLYTLEIETNGFNIGNNVYIEKECDWDCLIQTINKIVDRYAYTCSFNIYQHTLSEEHVILRVKELGGV